MSAEDKQQPPLLFRRAAASGSDVHHHHGPLHARSGGAPALLRQGEDVSNVFIFTSAGKKKKKVQFSIFSLFFDGGKVEMF